MGCQIVKKGKGKFKSQKKTQKRAKMLNGDQHLFFMSGDSINFVNSWFDYIFNYLIETSILEDVKLCQQIVDKNDI